MVATIKSNDVCYCGSGKKFKRCHKRAYDSVRPAEVGAMRTVPGHIPRPSWADSGQPEQWDEPRVKSPEILEAMRRTGALAADILAEVGAAVAPGVTTDQLDALAHELAVKNDAYPSPLNYRGFPKSLCTSINEVICHGIPDSRALNDGEIVNLDVTVWREGVHGDTNATFAVGQIEQRSADLIRVTKECLDLAVAQVAPGRPFNELGRAIETHAEAHGYGVVREFVGHGIGEQFHTDLQIPHYYNPNMTDLMEEGMTFTIEPMITLGAWRSRLWDDEWTAVTIDGSRTAQFEYTMVVTADGVELLTPPQYPDPR